jgi:uncharacterized membrane protein YfcA
MLVRRLICLTMLSAFPIASVAADDADVVVYGSTPGGFCAAAAGIAVAQRMRPRAIRIMGSRLPTVSRSRPFSTRSR